MRDGGLVTEMDKKQYYTNFLQKIVIGWVSKTIFRGQALKSWIQYRQKLSLFRALTFSRFLWVQQFLLTVSATFFTQKSTFEAFWGRNKKNQ